MSAFDPKAAARFIANAHQSRADYQNLPDELAPPTPADAYAVQEALSELWQPLYGPVAGLKIATPTKVMQQLMGIDGPCGGMIYGRRIHASPARLDLADYIHLVVEFELAVRIASNLPGKGEPYTRAEVRAAVAEVMPAFELIEDRHAHYKSTKALTLIADNAWNAGIVLSEARTVPADMELNGLKGCLTVDGKPTGEGLTDDPMGALAWLANLAAGRNRPLRAGMVVITGSVIATRPVSRGERLLFEIEGLGSVELAV
jgi:2-keto-4-pentenoate hydratase